MIMKNLDHEYTHQPDMTFVQKGSVKLKYSLIKMLLTAYKDTQFLDVDYFLRKLLVTFFYNEENVAMFNSTAYWTQDGLYSLMIFNFNLSLQITEYYTLMCEGPLIPVVIYHPSS